MFEVIERKEEVEEILRRSSGTLTEPDFEVIYRFFKPPLIAYAARRGAPDPEGLADSALMRVYELFGQIRSRQLRSFRSYLFSIANSQIQRETRGTSAPVIQTLEPLGESFVADPSTDITDRIVLESLLDELTNDQQAVIRARIFEDLSTRETAVLLGKTPNAVDQLQHRAISRLRRLMAGGVAVLLAVLAFAALKPPKTLLDDKADRTSTTLQSTTTITEPPPAITTTVPAMPAQPTTIVQQPDFQLPELEINGPEPSHTSSTTRATADSQPGPVPTRGAGSAAPLGGPNDLSGLPATATTTVPTTTAPTTSAVTSTTVAKSTSSNVPPTQMPIQPLVPLEVPAIDLEVLLNGVNTQVAPGPSHTVGESVTFVYSVTNAGDVLLQDLEVLDSSEGPISCPTQTLAVGESTDCVVYRTLDTVQEVQRTIQATAETPTSTATTKIENLNFVVLAPPDPAVSLDFQIQHRNRSPEAADSAPGPTFYVDQELTFLYEITNTGQVPVSLLTLVDSVDGAVSCSIVDLGVGESISCESSTVLVANQRGARHRVATVQVESTTGIVAGATDPVHFQVVGKSCWYKGVTIADGDSYNDGLRTYICDNGGLRVFK